MKDNSLGGERIFFLKQKQKQTKAQIFLLGLLTFDYEGTRNILMHTFLGISGL